MAMTPRQVRGAGRFFGWFVAVSLSIAVAGGLVIGASTGFGVILAILVFALVWTVATLPLVWLLTRSSGKRRRAE
ncbi:MAG TPA: hypothetical protein VMV72_10935 [Verrucomicrobiae bacterium]|nr:hypothetical protein [Verrucomicrobiae bacterium]